MHETGAPESKKPGWLSVWGFVILAAGFVGGHYTTIVTDWNTRNQQLDTVIQQLAQVSKDFRDFADRYNASHEAINGDIIKIQAEQQRIEDHLSHNDGRLDRLESRQR